MRRLQRYGISVSSWPEDSGPARLGPVCASPSKSVNQMEMNQCSSLGPIKGSSPSHRCGRTPCTRQTVGRGGRTHTELSDGLNGTE